MNGFLRAIGRVLRLVGISSPEDAGARKKTAAGVPSWRDAEAQKTEKPGGGK